MMHSCCSVRKMLIWTLCLIFFSLCNTILVIAFSSSVRHLCSQEQKDALWEFKSEFYVEGFHSNGVAADKKTERWKNDTDCCSWAGISCDPKTGKVVELDLKDSFLNGPLRSNSSLFRLQHLQSLDLGSNNISGILPDSIGNFKYLNVLSLGGCKFFGKIPSSLGNLSYLTDLDLSVNDFTGELPDSMGNLNQLTELEITSTKLSGNFPLVLLNLSELTYIDLRSNQFEGVLPSNFSSLSKLIYFVITGNSFSGSVPSSIFTIPSLTWLKLERNHFTGPLDIGNISSPSKLGSLSLGENNFKGPISGSISKLVELWFLDLSFWNTEKGMLDFNIFLHLKLLIYLDLSYLNTISMADLSLFSPLTSLSSLDLSGTNLNISSTLHLPLPIESLILSSCNIVEFPKFLQTTTNLIYLDLSANQIEGQVPDWLWSLPKLRYVNISQNFFTGFEGSSDVIQRSVTVMLDISSNTFHNSFPLLPNSMLFLSGSDNQFSGEIPRTICELIYLDTLVLSNNNFSGSIPRCFNNFNTSLTVLNLRNNSLSGVIPEESISDKLKSFDVGLNRLSGKLPKSLISCTDLEFLNVEDNRFNDEFPFWLRLLPNLQILVLRNNNFHGPISYPRSVSLSFPRLRIFDISRNHFTGVLPPYYFAGWSAMSSIVDIVDHTPIRFAGLGSGYYHKSVGLANKGSNMELVGSGFTIYITIDISGNRLQGNIPESIGFLKQVIVINMSNNAFTGHIPPSLSNLTNLQSLDLSQNKLSGKIPPELGKLTFLAWMNFSYNRLQGPIPQGTQFQSQNSSSFIENLGLCGIPLKQTCVKKDAATESQDAKKEESDQVFSWIAAAIGYVPGVVCGLTIRYILNSYKHDWFMRIFHSSS